MKEFETLKRTNTYIVCMCRYTCTEVADVDHAWYLSIQCKKSVIQIPKDFTIYI